jgi:hypothetical protein
MVAESSRGKVKPSAEAVKSLEITMLSDFVISTVGMVEMSLLSFMHTPVGV